MTNELKHGVEEVHYEKAEDFWSALLPRANNLSSVNMLYRGQADSSWPLQPTIIRLLKPPSPLLPPTWTIGFMAQVEWQLLCKFVEHCDAIGLSIPNDSDQLRKTHLYMENGVPQGGPRQSDSDLKKWPPREIFGLLALAQHHSLPTRLLDWTRRSFVAAYFAASEAALTYRIEKVANKNLAVWALCYGNRYIDDRLEFIRVAGSNNANLAAQAGAFTLLREPEPNVAAEKSMSLDQFLATNHLAVFRKLTLPVSQAEEILTRCEDYGVTGATLFPGYYGAAKAALDRYGLYLEK